MSDVKKLFEEMAEQVTLEWGEGCIAELMDEKDPEGIVLIKKNERVVASMPRQVFEELKELKDGAVAADKD